MPQELSNLLTVDTIVLTVFAIGSLLYTFMIGRGKLLAILVSTYMAFVLVHFAPFLNDAGSIAGVEQYIFKIIIFAVVFLVVLFLLSNIIFQTPIGSETLGWFFVVLFSILQVGFLFAVFFSFLPDGTLVPLSSYLKNIFVSDIALFIWALLPVVFLAYVGFRINKGMDEFEDDEEYEEEEYDDEEE